MGYRDDLAAAHGRIAALEAELRDLRAAASAVDARADAEEEIVALREQNRALRERLARAQEEAEKAAELRRERDRLVERVRVLQGKLEAAVKQAAPAAPAPRAAPAKPTPKPRAASKGTLWDHNRGFAKITAGRGAGVACPHCRAAGEEIEMVKEIGAYLVTSAADAPFAFANVACPRCLFAALMRTG